MQKESAAHLHRALRGLKPDDLFNLSNALRRLKNTVGGWDKLSYLLGISRQRLYDWYKAPEKATSALQGEKTKSGKSVIPPSLPSYEQAVVLGLFENRLYSHEEVTDEQRCQDWLQRVGLEDEMHRRADLGVDLTISLKQAANNLHYLVNLLPAISCTEVEFGKDSAMWATAYRLMHVAFEEELRLTAERSPGTIGFVWKWEEDYTTNRFRRLADTMNSVFHNWNCPGTGIVACILIDHLSFKTACEELAQVAQELAEQVRLQSSDCGRWSIFVQHSESVNVPHVQDVWFYQPLWYETGTYTGWLHGPEDDFLRELAEKSRNEHFNRRPHEWSTGVIRISDEKVRRLLTQYQLARWEERKLRKSNRPFPQDWVEVYVFNG